MNKEKTDKLRQELLKRTGLVLKENHLIQIQMYIDKVVNKTIEEMDSILWEYDITGESAWEFQKEIGRLFYKYQKKIVPQFLIALSTKDQQ